MPVPDVASLLIAGHRLRSLGGGRSRNRDCRALEDVPGRRAGARRARARGRARRGVRLPRAERRREEHDHPTAARPHPPHRRQSDAAREGQPCRRGGGEAARRLPPGRPAPVRPPHRPRAARLARTPPGGHGSVLQDELVERFQVPLGRPIRELSKGNRQKVGVVQAFMHRPDLVVLDEPTGGLDPLLQEEFRCSCARPSPTGAPPSSRRTRSTRSSTSVTWWGSFARGD